MFSGDSTAILEAQAKKLPSWALGNSGTSFTAFQSPGTPRTRFENIENAAPVHRLTKLAPSVALHSRWDMVNDFGEPNSHAEDLGGVRGTISSNTFQDDTRKFGSLTRIDKSKRLLATRTFPAG